MISSWFLEIVKETYQIEIIAKFRNRKRTINTNTRKAIFQWVTQVTSESALPFF